MRTRRNFFKTAVAAIAAIPTVSALVKAEGVSVPEVNNNSSRTITINGVSHDLSGKRDWMARSDKSNLFSPPMCTEEERLAFVPDHGGMLVNQVDGVAPGWYIYTRGSWKFIG
ncbi:MAG: hypothetical protein J7619_23215 [Dyadobacter sp.]|uniref:hypothetical protein n=1 Tax=Dyadobacter sp. TaxID=1914288 RepID=UPI001B15AB1E|nr:hypothetical protein [Dyadobacter sp.]MBO9615626.1 hypothetical protein [Dyadobacter sp.]